MIDIAFVAPALPASGALVLFVPEGASPSGLWAEFDAANGGRLAQAMEAAGFTGKKNSSCVLLAPAPGLSRLVAVGVGKDHGPREMEEAAGTAIATLSRDAEATLAADGMPASHAAHAAMGAALRAWRFDRYRTKEKPEDKSKLARVTVLTADTAASEQAWADLRPVAEGALLTRELVAEPANVLNPAELADRCRKLTSLGLEVEVLGPAQLAEMGFNTLLAVSQGSANEPRVVTMRWNGGGAGAKPVCFVGKGVTFDTGGISIKPAGGMEDMKWDMAGAGAVVGLMAALAGRKARANVVGIVGLVENMPSGTAMRPGDVVRSLSGQTVEVLNTDAEGRLVLADLLWHAQATYDPQFMVNLATLTGAIIVALGHEHAGLFSNDDELSARLLAAGTATGEALWRMPLSEAYDKALKSDIADMKNIGGRPGGSITGAQFIQRFVNKKPWAHLDIAGTAWSTKDKPVVPKGATAFGVRLLDRLVAEHYEGK